VPRTSSALSGFFFLMRLFPDQSPSPRVGKAACRAFEVDFFSKIKAVRTNVCDGYVISGNKAFIVYRIDVDHADWGTMKMSEVAIQEWSNGKVVREKFVY
jgi:hypothetical protein